MLVLISNKGVLPCEQTLLVDYFIIYCSTSVICCYSSHYLCNNRQSRCFDGCVCQCDRVFTCSCWFLAYFKKNLQEEKLSHPLPLGKIIGWTALGIVLAWGAQLIAILIETNLLGINEGSENTESIIDITRMNPLFFIIPVFTAPILEELIFRKIIFGTLYKRMNFFLAVLISSFLFGILHLELQHILIYFAMGVALAYVYVKTKRIIVPILVHMGMNALVVISQLAIPAEELEKFNKMYRLFYLEVDIVWQFYIF